MKSKMQLLFVLTVVLVVPQVLHAQATSRVIPFNGVATTIAPGSTGQALTLQVWDAASGGNLVFNEAQTLDVDANGNISFVLGALTAGGLDPNNFPSGSSRFLDVVDTTSTSVLAARIPLNANAFALSPGPAGPQGPQGSPGPPGPPGVVQAVTPGDTSISIGGSVANPTVAVAANGITNANVANGALSPTKISGTAATLGANSFTGNQTVTGSVFASGAVTAGAVNTATQYNIAGSRVVSIPGTNNLFVGVGAGQVNTMGVFNAFFGTFAGSSNTTGISNAFFGQSAGFSNTGSNNAFFGAFAGSANTSGSNNTYIGENAGGSAELTNATAIGFNALVTQSNSLVLGNNAKVGIGTTSPRPLLHVQNGASAFDRAFPVDGIVGECNSTGCTAVSGFSGSPLGSLGGTGVLGIANNFGGAGVIGEGQGGALAGFFNGSVRITGAVAIGLQSPAVRLQVVGDIRVGTSGTNGCVQNFAGTAIAGTCSSDARLKKNVRPFPAVLNKLAQLQPVSFYWKTQDYPEYHFGPSRNYGLIAQEVEKVFPEMVSVDERGFKAVNYSELPYVMLQAIRELKAYNDALDEQVRKLTAEVERLKARREH